jgi:methyl-accepting chemotaxis protein
LSLSRFLRCIFYLENFMQLATLMRCFTIRLCMKSAIVVVILALGTVGAINMMSQVDTNTVDTGLLTQETDALTEVARLQQVLQQQTPNDPILNNFITLVGDRQRATGDKPKTLQIAVDQVITLVIGASLLWLAIIVPLTRLNMHSICRPVERAEQFAKAIALGGLTDYRIDTGGNDETARLLRSLVAMQHSLASLIRQMRESSDSMSTASAEIAAGNQDLSLRNEQTASNLQQAAASLRQLTSTVRQTAESSRQANQLGSSAGEVVVSKVVSTISDIHTRSTKIIDTISVIDGIAFQTNILAWNAAVEAAQEIKNLIGASVERIDTGSRLVAAAGQTVTDIEHAVQRVTDVISEITAAATENLREQAQRLAQVVDTFKLNQTPISRTAPYPLRYTRTHQPTLLT